MNDWGKELNIEKLKILSKYYLNTQKQKAHGNKKIFTDLIKKAGCDFSYPARVVLC